MFFQNLVGICLFQSVGIYGKVQSWTRFMPSSKPGLHPSSISMLVKWLLLRYVQESNGTEDFFFKVYPGGAYQHCAS